MTAAGLEPRHPYAMSEEEYKASEWYDKRIPYAPNMTPVRARVMKEQRDRRDKEAAALDHDNQGAWRGALSLAGGLFAAIPDPINLIPLGAGLKAVTVGQAVRNAAFAGAAGNVAADALLFPWANAYGEDLGFAELAKDTLFGAALGGGFGAFGYGLARWLGKRRKAGEAPRLTDFDAVPDRFYDEFQDSLDVGASGARAAPLGLPAAERPALRHENVASLDELFSVAGRTLGDFQNTVTALAEATGGQTEFRPGDGLKTRGRAQEKIDRDYDGDAGRVVDVLGGTIVYHSRADVERAVPEIERLVREAGGEVVRNRNRFEQPSGGYKDFLLNIRQPDGFITELLLTTDAMNKAKKGVGHDLYEAGQLIKEFLGSGKGTAEEKKAARKLAVILDNAGDIYYGSTGDQSNATASLSGIVDPLNTTSPYMESLASSSIYGRLESLVGSIRNRLPSSSNTYGTSSYSRNLRTNTGALGPDVSQGPNLEASRPSMNRMMSGMEEPPSDTSNIMRDSAKVKSSGRVSGEETQIFSGDIEDAAHYEVRELEEVIPSHNPDNGFTRREDYPAVAQERPYHSDRGEQDKVRRNALEFKWRYLVNDNPSASDGPPITTSGGIVLGGNSRAMSLGLVYANSPEKAAAYKDALARRAAVFGIDPAAVEGMRQPVLVRVLDADLTPEQMAVKSRLYNQTSTQALQAKAEGVSKARLVSPDTLNIFAEGMKEFDSLREYLGSASSRKLVAALEKDGVLERTALARLVDSGGKLNDEGKTLVENALRGLVVADYDTLAAAPAAALNKLDRAVPSLARLKSRGEGWDLSGAVTAALRTIKPGLGNQTRALSAA